MDAAEFAQRWLGAQLKRNARPMRSAACPDCSWPELVPAVSPSLANVLVSCPLCGWRVALLALRA